MYSGLVCEELRNNLWVIDDIRFARTFWVSPIYKGVRLVGYSIRRILATIYEEVYWYCNYGSFIYLKDLCLK